MPNMDSEKYSLRQRQKRKQKVLINSSIDSQGYASDNSTESIQNLPEILPSRKAKKRADPIKNDKSKSKAAPLSKYRRKTANARERTRMREINTAFETLRTCVPPCITNEDSNSTNEKLTKITTLRLAMKYIGILSEALIKPHEADYDLLYECTQPRVIEVNVQPFIEEIEEIKEKPQKPAKSSKSNKKPKSDASKTTSATRKPASTKRPTKKQKLETVLPASHTSPIPSAYQESPGSNASSAYASLSSSDSSASPISNSSYVFENNQINNNFTYTHHHHHLQHHNSMSDLSNLMLESDGESLNLSERCFSPLQTSKTKSAPSSTDPYECSPTEMQTLENPLELSLRLMEPTTNSLSLSVDPIIPPSSCISPLMNLEPFSAFDLFHSEFSEQEALDLFLT